MARPCEALVWVGTKGFCCGGTRVQPWRLVLGASSIKGRRSETS
jgi:hypothetical protein